MKIRILALLAGVLAVALIAAGCGSSDDDTGGETSADAGVQIVTSDLSKEEFIAEADEICAAADGEINEEVEAFAEENGIDTSEEPSDEVKEELVTEVILPNIEGQADGIEELGAPEGDEETITEIVEGLRTAVAETGDDPAAVIDGGEGPFEDVNKQARAYGFESCGEG